MDYKKKYEEAERLYRTANADQRYVLEYIFPELCESENEKIRRALMKFIEKIPYERLENDGVSVKDALAWLEELGEQKPQRIISAEAKEAMYNKPAWSEEDQNALEDVREAVVHYWGGETQDILLYWLKSLKQRIAP